MIRRKIEKCEQPFQKTTAPIRSDTLLIGRSNTGDYKGLVDIDATTDFVQL